MEGLYKYGCNLFRTRLDKRRRFPSMFQDS